MATADEAVKMLQEVLLLNHDSGITTLVSYAPATMLRMQADEIERKEEVLKRAWDLVRGHK